MTSRVMLGSGCLAMLHHREKSHLVHNWQAPTHSQSGRTLRENLTASHCQRSPGHRCHAAVAVPWRDRTLDVKISLAKSSGTLDLGWLGLETVPPEIFEIPDLEVLVLAGNKLKHLPEEVGQFKSLKRLQLAGNQLTSLPPVISTLTQLEEVWFHGNLLEELPEHIGRLKNLERLSLAGNRLLQLPDSLAQLTELRELSVSGNFIEEVPASVGCLGKLVTLSMNGNRLKTVCPEIGGCTSLKFLNLQANQLTSLPDSINQLQELDEMNVADNCLEALPGDLSGLERMKVFWIYGNRIQHLPDSVFRLPDLECLWAEANPLERVALQTQLGSLQDAASLRELGLDWQQVEGIDTATLSRAGSRLRMGSITSYEPGYFKVQRAENGDARRRESRPKVLVVTFASAPGVPNWGGVLGRLAREATPEEQQFDILFVCDGSRNWYSGGDEGVGFWRRRLQEVTSQYSKVVMLGDSMGATGALLFSDLATSVQVFTPQVELSDASMRPGHSQEWLSQVKANVLSSVERSTAVFQCHSGTWDHDLQQVTHSLFGIGVELKQRGRQKPLSKFQHMLLLVCFWQHH